MSHAEEIRKGLNKLASAQVKAVVLTGKVVSVDKQKHTCDVDPADGGATIFSVRLKTVQSDVEEGTVTYPKVGSAVTILAIDNNVNTCTLHSADDVEEYLVKVNGGAELRVKAGGIVEINGDQYGGIIKWDDLLSDLNTIKTFLSTLRVGVQSAPIVANDGGASFKAALSATLAPLQLPQFVNITSLKTKHGSL